jgi:serine protease Do
LRVQLGLGQQAGVRVVEVQSGSPAQTAGLEPGDVILSLDQETVTGIDDIARVLDGGKIGKRVSVRILRDAQRIVSLELVPTER